VEIRAEQAEPAERSVESARLGKRRKSRAQRPVQIEEPELSTAARGSHDRHAPGVAFSDD
jgi:hypothetical protein